MATESKNVEMAAPAPETPAQTRNSSDRRNFIKSTVGVATGLAVGGLAAAPVAAADEPAAGAKAKLPGIVTARFDPKHPPKAKDVHEVLAAIFRRNGCSTCGLTGVDLRMRVADPIEQLKLDIADVPNVEVSMDPQPSPWKAQEG
jgi:hypothetical protein